jgi:hypothetical protein
MHDTNPFIEDILTRFRLVIGPDYTLYRNHVYRVFGNCTLLDNNPDAAFRYAVAAVFHDLGIWTAHTFDYILPSVQQASHYLEEMGRHDCIESVTCMIYWHHKITPNRGRHREPVEIFRKADWIDVSAGLLSFGANRQAIRSKRKLFPRVGFHLFLLRSFLRYFLRHPLRPLPMFRR